MNFVARFLNSTTRLSQQALKWSGISSTEGYLLCPQVQKFLMTSSAVHATSNGVSFPVRKDRNLKLITDV